MAFGMRKLCLRPEAELLDSKGIHNHVWWVNGDYRTSRVVLFHKVIIA
jgi:hypothetical protein